MKDRPAPVFRIVRTRLGAAALVASGDLVRRSYLPQEDEVALRERIARDFPDARESPRALASLAKELRAYFDGKLRALGNGVELDLADMTPFRQAIYRRLRRQPFGRTITYAELAAAVGREGAARGVGAAMARNPFPPLVPCHRVVGSDGGLKGFTAEGGLDLKRRMLELESAPVKRPVPTRAGRG